MVIISGSEALLWLQTSNFTPLSVIQACNYWHWNVPMVLQTWCNLQQGLMNHICYSNCDYCVVITACNAVCWFTACTPHFEPCSHVPTPKFGPVKSFNIVSMVPGQNGSGTHLARLKVQVCEHPHMLLCNPIFHFDGDGVVVGTCEQGFTLPACLPATYFWAREPFVVMPC